MPVIERRCAIKLDDEQVFDLLDTIDPALFNACIPKPDDLRAEWDDDAGWDENNLDWDVEKQTGTIRIVRNWSSYYGCADMNDSGEEEDFLDIRIEDGELIISGTEADNTRRGTDDEDL